MNSRRIFHSTVLKSYNVNPVIRWRPTSTLFYSSLIGSKTSFFIHRYHRPRRVVRIQSNSIGTASVVILATSLVAGSLYFYHSVNPILGSIPETTLGRVNKSEAHAIMAGTALPGRPGNLTADQEAKLQEMWTATLSIFEVSSLGDNADGDAASMTPSENLDQGEPRARVGTAGTEKKKKKGIGMLSRKADNDTSSGDTDGVSAVHGDDKYGQAKAYRKLLDSQSPEGLRKAFWSMVKHDNPDGLLLRFLRARKWDVQKALIMLVAAMHWRMQEMHVDDDIIKRGEEGSVGDSASSNAAIKKDGEDFLAQMRLGKSFLHGTDREGRPMCFVRVRLHNKGEQSESSLERYTVYTIETARYLLSSNIDTAVRMPL